GTGTDTDGHRDRERPGNPIGEVPSHDHHTAHGGAHRTDLAVGEVHDLAGAEHEDEPDGQEAVGHALDHPECEQPWTQVEVGHGSLQLTTSPSPSGRAG